MKKAQTEVTRIAIALPTDLDAIIQSKRREAFKAEKEGQSAFAEKCYREAWDLLPEPKHQWDSSLIMALDLVDFYFSVRNFNAALSWLEFADQAAEGSHNSGNLLWFGKIKYEQGEFEAARQAFDEVLKTWRTRPFRDEDPKYLEFYKTGKVISGSTLVSNVDGELPEGLYQRISEYTDQGNEFAENGDQAAALVEYTKALDLLPVPKRTWEAATWIYAAAGDCQFLLQRFEDARDALIEAQNSPGGFANSFITMRLGQTFFERGDYEQAKSFLRQAYMMEGKEIFEEEDPKYLSFLDIN